MTDDQQGAPEPDAELAARTADRLRVLTRGSASGWQPADAVRRTVVVRRRRRALGVGAVLVVAAATSVAVANTTGGSGHPTPTPLALTNPGVRVGARVDGALQLVSKTTEAPGSDPKAVAAVALAEQRLAIRLLQQVGTGGNTAVSPSSLYLALGMLQDGARGATATQIGTALQSGGLSTAEQNRGLAGLTAQLTAAAQRAGITLQSANSLWQQSGTALQPQFLADLAGYYQAGVWQADFKNDNSAATAALNAWVKRQTHGTIPKLFDQLDPDTALVLANALYLHAAWQTPFDPSQTTTLPFTTGAGTQVDAKFMKSEDGLPAAVGPGYQAAQLPYAGGRFAALAVQPTSGTLAAFLAGLTPQRLEAITGALHVGDTVELPRFTVTSDQQLNATLQQLGMRDAFTDGADLSGISKTGLKVDQVEQRVYLSVGEKGTTAAAATGVVLTPTAIANVQPVIFDHPFLFLIRDTQTGAVLFAATVQDPTAS